MATGYGLLLIKSLDRAAGTEDKSFFPVQVLAVSLGYFAAVLLSIIDYNFIAKLWPVVAAICVGAMLLTFTGLGIGVEGADDRAWLDLGVTTFQPSELLKIGFIITFAKHLAVLKEQGKLHSFPWVCTLVAHAAIPMVLVHFQGDDGPAIIFLFMFLIMAFAAGVQLRYFLIAIAAVLCAVPILWQFVMNEDQKSRILSLFDLDGTAKDVGWQQYQGKISIASGELEGRGLFQGPRVSKGIVPYQENDFIFTVAGEELGFIGCVILLGILLFLLLRSLQNASIAKDPLGCYICFGFFALIGSQSIINIGMCLGLLPVVGVTLPFFSAGGSSVACLYLAVGLVESVYMHQQNEDKVTIHLSSRQLAH